MESIISKQIAEELMKMEGKARGLSIKGDIEYIIHKEGKEGLKRLEEEMERLGYPFKYEEIKITKFYPIGLRAVTLLVMKKILGFSDDKIREIGAESLKFSPVIRFLMPIFALNTKEFVERTPSFWGKFSTIGTIVILVVDEKNKKIRGQLKDIKVHPIIGLYIEGLFAALIKIVTGSKEAVCKAIKSPFRGDDFYEFEINYK